jgi:hypothetical protein
VVGAVRAGEGVVRFQTPDYKVFDISLETAATIQAILDTYGKLGYRLKSMTDTRLVMEKV